MDTVTLAKLPKSQRRKDGGDRGYVYFIECGDFIKIGFTIYANDRRVRSLQGGTPHELRLIGKAYAAKSLEARLHKTFAHLRHRGEWFRKAPDLTAMIESLI